MQVLHIKIFHRPFLLMKAWILILIYLQEVNIKIVQRHSKST